MLHLILGNPKSGKSEYAEKLVAEQTGATIYIATLPVNPFYSETIIDHRKRRPSNWELIELIGDPLTDLELVSNALPNFRNILLDGLLFYLIRVITKFNYDLIGLWKQGMSLIDQAASKGELVMVDPPVPKLDVPHEQRILLHAQLLIARRADRISLVSNRMVIPLKRSEVLQLNR